ncbi:hypothetical protein D6T64_13140 [Cryobacterium melibiosiphilum]|uniref:Uncharacterized protein n=1 Tax=Cryobacterium melibiosiphilum TaxID=995039 RepID=A0A3A5MCE7_9MICO|nr:hypothetical protein [Cryobacterium melibiosiphilum]RJT87800.1 hypothetical protein D6T64_13140 [Cryobacterium melibiosiphilum]
MPTNLPESVPSEKPSVSAEPSSVSQAVISVAGIDPDGLNVSVSGYVSGLIETGELCEFRFTSSNTALESSTDGIANASDTSCGLVQMPVSGFASGSWQVTLTYTNKDLSVTSQPTALEIP